MRVLFALPGLHKIDRGAEVAFISVANELAKAGCQVTLVGSGQARHDTRYHFSHVGSIARDYFRSFPSLPALRDDCAYEELTFAADFMFRYRPSDYDVTVTCSYPFTNWICAVQHCADAVRRTCLSRKMETGLHIRTSLSIAFLDARGWYAPIPTSTNAIGVVGAPASYPTVSIAPVFHQGQPSAAFLAFLKIN